MLAETKEPAASEEELDLRERQAERQELVRLLQTARDADRKAIIHAQIAAIDAVDADPSSNSDSALQSNIARLHASVKVPLDTVVGSGRHRPTSAQRRRPSFTPSFEVVPENRTLLHRSIDRTREQDLYLPDVEDVFASCHDPRHPPLNLIRRPPRGGLGLGLPSHPSAAQPASHAHSPQAKNGMSPINTSINTSRLDRLVERSEGEGDSPRPGPLDVPAHLARTGSSGSSSGSMSSSSGGSSGAAGHHFWVSTGGSPQGLVLTLRHKWLIRRVTLRCDGVSSVALCVDGLAHNKFGTSSRLSDATFFVFDLTDVPSEDPGGVVGRTLILSFSSAGLFTVHDLQIKAVNLKALEEHLELGHHAKK